jgi:hypothetical protein
METRNFQEIKEGIILLPAAVPKLMQLHGVDLKVLVCCWKAASYNNHTNDGNIIYNNPVFKKMCTEEGLNASPASIDNAISKLTKSGLLIRQHKGIYSPNPEYFIKCLSKS